jgi:putative ABC transport system permease protein
MRLALFADIVTMALGTLRTNKMRSVLTVLGVVIGITSIVGMTSLVRGFDQSLRDSIRELGPKTIFIAKFSGISFAAGNEFKDLIKRPVLTVADAKAIEREATTADKVDVWLGVWGIPTQERIFYKNEKTKALSVWGVTENYAEANFLKMEQGRFFTGAEVRHREAVVALGQTAHKALFPYVDPIGKHVRIGAVLYEVVGVIAPRPNAGGLGDGQDDFVVVPYTTFQKQFGWAQLKGRVRVNGAVADAGAMQSAMIIVVPREDASQASAMREVEQIMRVRHNLTLDKANDFDMVTQDAALKVWDQLTGYIFLGLVAMSSIALLVGGIGVMAIMMISVTERTREIGVRKALGARRREILWQFLLEAVVLTSVGGILGIVFGASIGLSVHYFTSFPVSLPLWSFALGIGFSASVGIFFGMYPAFKAARLDPIEALRYE